MPHTLLLVTDHKLSVIAEQADDKPNSITYCAYGQPSAPQPLATRLAFNGAFRERPIGWYFLGNGYRIYNPVLRCFHSPDSWSPFGEGGLNGYGYCAGDPVNHADPSGHMRRVLNVFKKKERSPSPPPELKKTVTAKPNKYIEKPVKVGTISTSSAATSSSAFTSPTASSTSTPQTALTPHEIMWPRKQFNTGRTTHITLGEMTAAAEAAKAAAEKAKLVKQFESEVEAYQDEYGDWKFRPIPSAATPADIRDPNPKP